MADNVFKKILEIQSLHLLIYIDFVVFLMRFAQLTTNCITLIYRLALY